MSFTDLMLDLRARLWRRVRLAKEAPLVKIAGAFTLICYVGSVPLSLLSGHASSFGEALLSPLKGLWLARYFFAPLLALALVLILADIIGAIAAQRRKGRASKG